MQRRKFLTGSGGLLVTTGCCGESGAGKTDGARGRLTAEVYAWQRQWTPAVVEAVRGAGRDFGMICYLAGERESLGPRGKAEWQWVRPDGPALCGSATKVAAALRLSVPAGPLEDEAGGLREAAQQLQARAAALGVTLVEWHLDLDCPRSRLGEYAALMRALQRREHGANDGPRWVITALPDWLGDAAFPGLVQAAGRWVLQVHALQLPGAGETEGSLCDTARARRWVGQAARLGVPYRVALPTYASRVFFDRKGKVLDVAGEDSGLTGPAGAAGMCLMRSDAAALAGLVQEWTDQPPVGCTGLIWYRLPVAGDRWNWSMDALREVMMGRAPKASVGIQAVQNKAGFYELEAKGSGGVESRIPGEVIVSGPDGAGVRAWDVHGNWKGQILHGKLVLRHPGGWLFPGQSQRPGWVRLDRPGAPIITTVP